MLQRRDEMKETPRSKLKRASSRGSYDLQSINQILDEALICHVGFVQEGQPFVIPTIHARDEKHLLLHGSVGSRLIRHISESHPICVSVTILDGLVLARSAVHHSMNYRSVVLFGQGALIEGDTDKEAALFRISEHIMPSRWAEVRGPSDAELKRTAVVKIPIDEGSAKMRTGPPGEEPEDYALRVWAGVLPLALRASPPEADPLLADDIEVPEYLKAWIENTGGVGRGA